MKTVLLLTITWAIVAVPCYGQVRAVEAGSAEAARLLEEHRRRAADAAEDWRTSKKLTLMNKIPESPRGQGECLSPSDLQDDSFGYLEYWYTEVAQVIGASDVLLIVGNPRNPPIWLEGCSTKGLADGDKVRLVGLVHVKGTKSYTTVAGAQKTVRVVRLVTADDVHRLEAEAEDERLAAEAAAKAASFRTWTDATGDHRIVARFLDFKNGHVFLERKDDQKTIEVPSSRLSKEDQEWVRDELRTRKETDQKDKEAQRKGRKGSSR